MPDPESSSLSLAGSLLSAHPNLLDPTFKKTVLFLSDHDAMEGSFGFVLNRPSGRSVGDLLPDQTLGRLADVPVLVGGPVAMDQLIFASFQWDGKARRVQCRHHLLLDAAQAAMDTEHTLIRAFIGYAGWTKGQLDAELAQKAWLVGKPTREVLRLSRCMTLWRETVSAFGPWFQLVAEAPEKPSLN